ncbi:unnamed protein product [Penicillium roqueforti FM164]|uniref:Genomic scaffold, ProqFM164S04 n=1 Tax=Penicillium roqueforti (strain FM164) TaxID=1365484 RepID=W6QIH7_PENRF|nr:unnamed protein product [Penicillium roqueforti FM164]
MIPLLKQEHLESELKTVNFKRQVDQLPSRRMIIVA